jgi:hypothetical protein
MIVSIQHSSQPFPSQPSNHDPSPGSWRQNTKTERSHSGPYRDADVMNQ